MIVEREVQGERRLCVEGPLNIDAAAAALAAAGPLVSAGSCTLDLSAVTELDSAAVSVVLALLRASRAAGHSLALVNAPASFASLAELYGVESLLTESLSAHAAH